LHIQLFPPQVAPFPRVGIEASHQNAGPGDAVLAPHIPVQDGKHLFQQGRGNGIGHGPQG